MEDPSVLVESLPGLLGASDVAAVLVRLAQTDHRSMIGRAKALAPAVQTSDAALLLDGHPELIAPSGADGAHLTGVRSLETALSTLKPDRIGGVGGLKTWHDSMTAGDADYVLFGEPNVRVSGLQCRRYRNGHVGRGRSC